MSGSRLVRVAALDFPGAHPHPGHLEPHTSVPTPEVALDGEDVISDYTNKYSNWERWGKADEFGSLVGPEQGRRPRSPSASERSSR